LLQRTAEKVAELNLNELNSLFDYFLVILWQEDFHSIDEEFKGSNYQNWILNTFFDLEDLFEVVDYFG